MAVDDGVQVIEAVDPKEIYKLIAAELEAAKNESNDDSKIFHLRKAQDILLTADEITTVLDNFTDDFLNYLKDGTLYVKLFIFEFIQKVFERDPSVLKKVNAPLVNSVLCDGNGDPILVKKLIILVTQLYPNVLAWVASKANDNEAEFVYLSFDQLKLKVMQLMDSRNEGIRVLMMRFLETMIICQTVKDEWSDTSKLNYDMSLNQVSRGHRFISYRKLEMEASLSFDNLTKQISSSRTSLLHLISALTAMAHIVRARPKFFDQMIEVFESLHQNLPPTLGTGQVKSVRKELKNNFLRLLKHPYAPQKIPKMQTLLQELGATFQEINKNMPANSEINAHLLKRRMENAKKATLGGIQSKKPRLDDDDYDDQKIASAFDEQETMARAEQKAIDITTDWVMERMRGDVISRIVYMNLLTMPDQMPPAFNASYYSIPEMLTTSVKRNVARMLAKTFARENRGPGAEYLVDQKKKFALAKEKAKQEGAIIPPTPMDMRDDKDSVKMDHDGFKIPKLQLAAKKPAVKYDIFAETQALDKKESKELILYIFKKMKKAEANLSHPDQKKNLYKAMINMVARRSNEYTATLEEQLMDFVINDQERRGDIIFLWLEELYSQWQGHKFCVRDDGDSVIFTKPENHERYDTLLINFLSKLFAAGKHTDPLFHKIFINAQVITQGALGLLRKACMDPATCQMAMSTLKESILSKSVSRPEFLKLLLELSYVDQDTIKYESINVVKQLFDVDYVRSELQDYLCEMCDRAAEKTVPPLVFMAASGFEDLEMAEEDEIQWDENYARSALTLILHMVPLDTSLISKLCHVLAKANQKVKKFIISSVKANLISIDDANLLYAIDHCPPGGEPLIARFVTLLTDRSVEPTPELVERLKNLVSRYNSDVRALIPILSGMTKEECLDLVPQFVLSSTCMRSVPTFYKKVLRSSNPQKAPLVSVNELILKLHSIQGVNKKAVTLLHDNIDVLLVDKANEFFEESEKVPQAIESLAQVPNVNQFVFHSIERIFEKYVSLGPKLSKLLLVCSQKEGWDQDAGTWDAFKSCVKALGIYGFNALVFGISWDRFKDIATENDASFGHNLETFISTLSAHDQQKIDKRLMEFVKIEASKDDKSNRKRTSDFMLESGWIQPFHLQGKFQQKKDAEVDGDIVPSPEEQKQVAEDVDMLDENKQRELHDENDALV